MIKSSRDEYQVKTTVFDNGNDEQKLCSNIEYDILK